MYKLTLLSVGKNKEEWLEQALKEYTKRLQGNLEIRFVWVKDDGQLEKHAAVEKLVICLDPSGREFSSEAFCDFLFKKFEEGGTRLCMVIGGPEGLPDGLRRRSELLSLSKLTLTHQCARLILIEQVYRAFEIRKGSQYHK